MKSRWRRNGRSDILSESLTIRTALQCAADRRRLALPGDAHDGEEAGHVLAAAAREPAALGEAPEGRLGIAGEGAVHTVFSRIIGGERERPVVVALVEQAEVPRGGARRPLGLQAVVAMGVHHQPEAAGGRAAELPEAALATASARGGIEAALDHREERKAGRHAVRLENPAETGQVARPARQALRRLPAEPGMRAEPLLPGVDARVVGSPQAA